MRGQKLEGLVVAHVLRCIDLDVAAAAYRYKHRADMRREMVERAGLLERTAEMLDMAAPQSGSAISVTSRVLIAILLGLCRSSA